MKQLKTLDHTDLMDQGFEGPRAGFGPHGPGFGAHRPGLETHLIFRHKTGCPLYQTEEDVELKVIEA